MVKQLFVLGWRPVLAGRVQSSMVVVIDPGEDRSAALGAGGEVPPTELFLEGGEPRLGDGVIEALSGQRGRRGGASAGAAAVFEGADAFFLVADAVGEGVHGGAEMVDLASQS